jgi:hypothetical protein
MSFFPIPYLNLSVCEISILASSVNLTASAVGATFGSILSDTGGEISLDDSTTINLPANKTFFIKTNIIIDSSVTTGSSYFVELTDQTLTSINHQSRGSQIARTGVGSGVGCLSIEMMAVLFPIVSTRQIKVKTSSDTAVGSIPYNSANAFIPNSSITILYG